jgi:shikimate 5-dehydrogenase
MGAVGFNVTMPHKSLVAELVPGARLGSVNTLYRGKRGWKAASTDGEGFAKGLARVGNELATFAEIVVLGGGGAAQAVLRHALETTDAHVTVLRRGRKRDAALTRLTRRRGRLALLPLTPAALKGALAGRGGDTLLVQATSAPSAGDDLSAFVPALDGYGGVVSDLVYAKPSALYFAALARDLVAQDGESMLIEQARLSQLLWWGRCAPYEEMALALRNKD